MAKETENKTEGLVLDSRERACILASLRETQRLGYGRSEDISTDAGAFEALDAGEIDDLCIKINYAE